MIIILEGCDASGKDTTASTLTSTTGFEIVRGSSFEISSKGIDAMFEYSMKLLDMDNVIINRFFYSNLVYAPLYGYPKMTDDMFEALSKKLESKDSLVVYLHSDEDIIKERILSRGDDDVKASEIPQIIKMYDEVMTGKYRPPAMLTIDTNKTDIKKIKIR